MNDEITDNALLDQTFEPMADQAAPVEDLQPSTMDLVQPEPEEITEQPEPIAEQPEVEEKAPPITFDEARIAMRGGMPLPQTELQMTEISRLGGRAAEMRGYMPTQRDSALVEFGQNITGSLVDSIRMMASSGEEVGLFESGTSRAIEDWQEVNQHLKMYEGAKPFSSWGGFFGSAGQVVGYAVPTIAVGAIAAKIGGAAGLTGAAINAVARSGTAVAMHSQFFGDKVKFFRDEVGLSPVQSIMMGFSSASIMTIPEMVFGVERRIADALGTGISLNTIKEAGLKPALKESIERTSREALVARVTGNVRPYFSTLKSYGISVGSESATEMIQLAFEDFNRVAFSGREFSSLNEYFETGVSVIPGTLLLGSFAAYREHRNQMIVDDLLKPVSQKELASAAKVFGSENMQLFAANVDRLRSEFLTVMKAAHGEQTAADMANASADLLAKMALKSAAKVDRADGKKVNPNDFVDGFRAALASRNITADEFSKLSQMTSEQAMNALSDWGILDELDRIRKSSDSEENTFISNELKKDMQIILDPVAVERRQDVIKAAMARRGMEVQVEVEVDPLEGIIPAQTKDKILEAKKQGEKQRKDPIAEAAKQAKRESKGKIYTGPMSIEQARGSAMIVNQSPTTKEAATVLSSPAIVTMGDDKFIEMVADNGAIVLVPAREIEVSEGKVTLMPAAQVVAERKLITEVIPADPMSMGEQQQKALFGAIGEANLDRMTREEVEAMQSTLDKIAKRGTGVLEERTTELQSKALEAVRRFEERNNIVSDQPTPPVEQDTLADAMFRLKVGIDKETDLVRQRNIPTPIKTPEEEARMIKAESLKSVIDAAMRRRGMDDAAQLLQRPEQMNLPGIQFMAVQRGDIWTPPPQQITSAATSINEQRLPATFNRVTFEQGTINADIGGGRFDNGTQFLASKGVQNIIYDPFNRSAEYNAKSVEQIRGGKADTVTVNNVLNVIQEQLSRDLTIAQAADALKPDGTAYFLIYEGDKSSLSRETTKGWQENRPAESYMAEIGMHFGDVSRSGNLIIAKDPIKEAMGGAQFMVIPPRTEPREPMGGRMTGGDIIAGVKPPQNIGNSVKDISTYLNESGKQAGVVDYRSSNQKENEQVEDSIVDMLRESVRIHPESVGWYRENVDLAMSVMRELDSDLSKNENSFRLKLAIALTSDGNEVDQNFQMGWNVYNNWKSGKSFDATMGLGARQSSIKDKLVAANKLIDKLGGEVAAEKWLLQKDTVGNIAAELQGIYGITRKQAMDMLGGELVTTVVPKAVIFGPKLGSFFNNLSGDYSTVTMDLWFMRSVGRMTGTLVYEETKESIAQGRSRLSDALKSSPAALKFLGLKSVPKNEKLDELATSILNRSIKKDFREALSELEGGEEVRLAGNARGKVLKGDRKESPSSGAERQWLRERMENARQKLNQEGIAIELADMQAAMWYGEKEIYHAFGYRTRREAADYGSAAEGVYQRVRGGPSTVYATSAGRVGGIGRASVRGDSEAGTAGGVAYMQVGYTPPAGLYLASEKIALFFNNSDLTPATLLHEWFHHIQAAELMPTALKAALDKEFGGIANRSVRLEREAEAFTRYLTDGRLPMNADDELAKAFDYVKRISAAAYQQAKSNWGLPESVRTELDNLFAGVDYSFEHESVGQATQAALEYDRAVNFMAMSRNPEMIKFHKERKSIGLRMGLTDSQVRQMLRDGGFKPYILASDDPSGQQRADMTKEEMVEAYEFLSEKNTGLSEKKRTKQQKEMDIYREENAINDFRVIASSIASRPSVKQNYNDALGGYEHAQSYMGVVKKAAKNVLMKASTYWNIAKVLDAGDENGPVSTMVRDRVNAGESAKYETMEEINTMLVQQRKSLGEVADINDLGQVVDLGPIQLQARKVAAAYMFIKSGWGKQLGERNVEFTPDVQRKVIDYVDSTPKIKNYVLMNKATLQMLHPKLMAASNAVGVQMGDLGEWYLPFMSEDSAEQQKNLIDLFDRMSPSVSLYGERGMRTPSQIKTRSDLGDLGDDLARQRHLNSLGRLELRMDHILARYYESSSNYIGKAPHIKHMLQVLENPMLVPLVREKHGDDVFLKGLIKNIRSELYPGGRSTPLGSGERMMAVLRGNATLAMLGWRIRSIGMQTLAIPQGWAAFASRPKDVTRTLGYFLGGLTHGEGFGKFTKAFKKEQLADFEPYQEMIKDWPQLKYRAFEPEYRDLQMLDNPILNSKFARSSLDGMRMMDMVGVTALYKSAKMQRMELNEVKVAEGKMTLDQANRDAANFALQVIDKTQNPSNLSQRALLQKESEWVKTFNPFSGQRFVNFNYYVYDMILPILEDVKKAEGFTAKTGAALKGIWDHKRQLLFASAVPAMMMGAIYRLRMPDDEEEIAKDLLIYPLATIPFVGQWAQSAVSGKFTTYSYDPTMLGTLARSAVKVADTTMKAAGLKGGWKEIDWQDATAVRRVFTILTGTPDYPLQVGQNFIEQMGWVGKPEGEITDKILKTLAIKPEESK